MSVCRCRWVNMGNPLYIQYHDAEWGVPQHTDQMLFELLILEGFQAGLSLKFLFDIASAIENPADFHRPIYDDIENCKIAYLDAVIRMFSPAG